MFKKLLACSLFILTTHLVVAQTIVIEQIILIGNKHTKDKVILAEIDFEIGDSIQLNTLNTRFDKNKYQILSTGLFNTAELNLKNYKIGSGSADIEITTTENWYLYPVPIFELADRNFNVWWNEQEKSLDRINYGVRLNHYNFTGNRDPFKLKIQFGYTRKFEINYSYPYWLLDKKLGLAGSIFYADNKEIAYITQGNKTQFYKHEDERIMLSRFRIGPELKYRPTVNQFHSFRIEFHKNTIDEYVPQELNPNYFRSGALSLSMIYLEYDFQIDRRKYTTYPRSGWLLFFNLKKEGVGIFKDVNNFNVELGMEHHQPIAPKLVLGNRLKAKTNELYVMDGIDFFINKNRLSYRLLDNNIRTSKLLPRQFERMSLSIYLRFNFDTAIVNEPTYIAGNTLNNRWIYGYGPAIDFIAFNNFVFSFEYSFNDIGEHGLFFHNTIVF